MIVGIDVSRGNSIERTGVEWYSFYLTQSLLDVLPSTSTTVLLYAPTAPVSDWRTLPTHCQWTIVRGRFVWTQFHLNHELQRHPPDRLFIPAYRLPPFLKTQTRSIVTIHDIGFISHPTVYSRYERLTQCWILRNTLERANAIIVPTQAVSDALGSLRGPKPPIHVISHGAPPIAQQLAHSIKNQLHFLYIGRIEVKKNILTLLRAFEILSRQKGFEDLRLTLIGKPGYGSKEIKTQIDSSRGYVEWLGFCNEKRANEYRSQAQYLVLPSLIEGFGFPLLEAWQWGSVPIVSDIPPLREVGGDAAIYVEPTNLHAWVRTIMSLHSSTLERIIDQGKHRLHTFQWNRSAQMTAKVIINA